MSTMLCKLIIIFVLIRQIGELNQGMIKIAYEYGKQRFNVMGELKVKTNESRDCIS